ncbi:MAG: patatin-like phospholipase family protein [Candidatus Marinimicrobia bacterium]|jgi:NTE family protein|nr:patatin-like phospholipase family protein [Candidatus Neomarinimicrobiota bacterium]MDP6611756.1 patatin-like phospholipase family protein [Candidatus Neomarinimicrobiota bacterium]|tara:strand:- start:90238 stop:91152 length:915 start_codon:yes stop_codon:yes gene_type:complete
MPRPKIGLALGGGGARGAAHIGALQVLQKNNIPIHQIAGTSAGSVIGAMYAATLDPDWVENRFREFLKSEPFKALGTDHLLSKPASSNSAFNQFAKKLKDQVILAMSLHRNSIMKKSRLKEAFDFLIPVKTFEELQIPLKIIATDLNTCRRVVYDSGDLIEAATRSGTIPGYVEPTEIDGQLIVDGGVSMPLPTSIIRDEVDILIGIDIRRRGVKPLVETNIYEIMMRSDMSTYQNLINHYSKEADLLISPDVKDYLWSEFGHFDYFFNEGIRAAENSIMTIRRQIDNRKSLIFRLKQWFGLQN